VILRHPINSCGIAPERCNYKVCKEKCEKDNGKPCNKACNDLLESVALVETALSHILNAEGEKMQAMIGMDDVTAAQLLKLNRSAARLIGSASRLEAILQVKLSGLNKKL